MTSHIGRFQIPIRNFPLFLPILKEVDCVHSIELHDDILTYTATGRWFEPVEPDTEIPTYNISISSAGLISAQRTNVLPS